MQQVSPRLPACSIEVWPVFQEDLPRESTQLLGALFAAGLGFRGIYIYIYMCVCFALKLQFAIRNLRFGLDAKGRIPARAP